MKREPLLLSFFFVYAIMMGWHCQQPNASNLKVSANNKLPVEKQMDSLGSAYPSIQDSLINKEYLLGKFDPSSHPLFKKIPDKLTTKKAAYLRTETIEHFEKMHAAAAKDGVRLIIVSATRNFNAQKQIWEAKWSGRRSVNGKDMSTVADPAERARIILKFSSMPGSSRHHWGTDIDINSVEPSYFKTPKGAKEYTWLAEHAREYGFCQTYTPKDSLRPNGYEEEAWHWSYTPVSSSLLKKYLGTINHQDIKGFQGDHTASKVRLIEDYVAGINAACQ